MTEEEIQQEIEKRLAEAKADFKSKLDSAYKARDEADKLREAAVRASEALKAEQEAKRLEEEGKMREAYELRLKAATEEAEALKARNIELTRDTELGALLSPLPFVNTRALESARRDIVSVLSRNESGQWVYGKQTLPEVVKAFAEDPENAHLFKVKETKPANIPPSLKNPPAAKKRMQDMTIKEMEEHVKGG